MPALRSSADFELCSTERPSGIGPDFLRSLQQVVDRNREVETVAGEARRAVESLLEHAQLAERELRAIEKQVGDLRSAIDSLQSMASVLRRTIGDMEGRANDLLGATEQAVETGVLESQLRDVIYQQLLPRLADFQALLVHVEELLARLQEGRTQLGHLHEVTREWTEVIMRYRQLVGIGDE